MGRGLALALGLALAAVAAGAAATARAATHDGKYSPANGEYEINAEAQFPAGAESDSEGATVTDFRYTTRATIYGFDSVRSIVWLRLKERVDPVSFGKFAKALASDIVHKKFPGFRLTVANEQVPGDWPSPTYAWFALAEQGSHQYYNYGYVRAFGDRVAVLVGQNTVLGDYRTPARLAGEPPPEAFTAWAASLRRLAP